MYFDVWVFLAHPVFVALRRTLPPPPHTHTHAHTCSQLPLEILKAVLTSLNEDVLPHLAQPKLLIDFLTDAYNMDGVVAILALHGLFTLIYKHNLCVSALTFFPRYLEVCSAPGVA